jgi:hypothetical protein
MFLGREIQRFIKIVSFSLLAIFFQSSFLIAVVNSENAYESGFTSLSALTDRFSTDLSRDLTGKKLYFDNKCVREVGAHKTSNFSLYLQNELESSFSRNGFVMVYEPAEANYLIGATYQRQKAGVRVFFKYHKADLSGKKGRAYEIHKSNLPGDAFEESIQTKAYDLATSILEGQKPRKILVRPLLEGHRRYATDFSNSFISRIKGAMVKLGKGTEIIDEKPVFQGASNISYSGVNAILDGVYYDRGPMIFVHLNLRNLEGRLLSSSVLEIDKSLIQSSTENKTAKKLLDFLDQPQIQGDFHVKISTPKGENYPIYLRGEKFFFQIQVADSFYIYLYAINSKGKVSLLFPLKREGIHQKFMPGRLHTIPGRDGDFEIEVKPPFGMEAVKVFASNVAVSLPELIENKPSEMFDGGWPLEGEKRLKAQLALSRMATINPRDLVGFFRGFATKTGASLYEDSLLLETRGK